MKRLAILACIFALAACSRGEVRRGTSDISGVMPDLAFTMTRANDGATVTADNYRGKAIILYFGYTHCPDECPTTLANLARALGDLGPRANQMRVLFVSIDPKRDTLPLLKAYVSTFAPQIDGLRGTDNQIARLARRYRVLYRVTRAAAEKGPEVMHSNSTFFFDSSGHARFVTTRTADTKTIVSDLRRLVAS
ncbi:MAG: SCO family protein [Alphaproteobacteria bacterium]|nr:SCO family protein [Alphaproteobacteria bacterium]